MNKSREKHLLKVPSAADKGAIYIVFSVETEYTCVWSACCWNVSVWDYLLLNDKFAII